MEAPDAHEVFQDDDVVHFLLVEAECRDHGAAHLGVHPCEVPAAPGTLECGANQKRDQERRRVVGRSGRE